MLASHVTSAWQGTKTSRPGATTGIDQAGYPQQNERSGALEYSRWRTDVALARLDGLTEWRVVAQNRSNVGTALAVEIAIGPNGVAPERAGQ